MALQGIETFGDGDVDEWKWIAGGGFGKVYRVRHKERGLVAIKLLLQNTGSTDALNKEADILKKMSSQFVLNVYGIFRGKPFPAESEQQGIVMEFMKLGCIHTLQTELRGPPPLPLAVRLAYQVALGMQHLHSNNILHHDLKPSNVLLDNAFNAKLADFGLSRTTTSALSNIQQSTEGAAGTYKYMPPEAFELNYNPVRSFDVYSYGILLWSIFSGEEPYPGKSLSIVELRVKAGDRPNVSLWLENVKEKKEKVVELMKHCWDGDPSKRPRFDVIVKDIMVLFSHHKDGIAAAIEEVSSKLEENRSKSSSHLHQANAKVLDHSPTPVPNDIVDHPRAEQLTPVDDETENLTEKDKARFIDDTIDDIIQENTKVMAITEELLKMKMVHKEAFSKIKAKDTNEEKMRELYRTSLRSGGEKVKAAFYDALKKLEPEMLKISGDS